MHFKVRLWVVIAFVLLASGLNAQTTKTCAAGNTTISLPVQAALPDDDGTEVIQPFDGTYRFIFTRGVKQVFTDEILKVIADNRSANEEVTVVLSTFCRVKILSKLQISSTGFVPFTKSYVFEN